ncbi:pore-forming ESAT-6 family protein [Paracoccus siganidrum]|uniref:Uncharacterized protein n=1 Tax=Paracoccus siganidrum TaxID=1276757 RepID=A0A418ZRU6_9RHOB|nr:pore-forming ESAT-6 family protein [Paracoccus siganidrum]RJK98744.1 hypothetical protein D3P05_23625 [Paracoccus siganidrum]RMC29936.1 hypothetical protein C9E82_19335 [Paracoccus siganidrum]
MIRKLSLIAAFAVCASPVLAQDEAPAVPEADPAAAYEAARNQLGILKFCNAQGFSGEEAIVVQERVLGMIPQGDAAAGDAAEAKGTEGVVSAMGAEVSLEDSAAQQGTTAEAQCQQIESLVNQLAAQLPAE